MLRAADRGPSDPFVRDDDPLLGWSRFLEGTVSSAEVPGQHADLFARENVVELAATLRRDLDDREAPRLRAASSRVTSGPAGPP